MFGDVEKTVAVAWRAAVGTWFALARQTQPGMIVHAGRNVDFAGDFLLHIAGSPARAAGRVDHLFAAVA